MPFHPYYTIKDGFALVLFVMLFAAFVFYAPNCARPSRQLRSGQSAADAAAYRAGMVLPAVLRDPARHPEQAVRRASRCVGAIAVLFFVPWLDTSQGALDAATGRSTDGSSGRSCSTCLALGYLGSQPPEGCVSHLRAHLHRLLFPFFLVIMPVVGLDRDAEAAARQHHRGGARPEEAGGAPPDARPSAGAKPRR